MLSGMFFLPLLVLVLIFALLSSRQRRILQGLQAVTTTVGDVTTAVLSNDLARINTPPPTTNSNCRFISELAKKHLYRGELRAEQLRLLQQVVVNAGEQLRLRWQLRLLFLTRIGGVIVFSMLGNFLLSHLIATAPPAFYIPIIGSIVLLAGVWLLEKNYACNLVLAQI